MRRRTVLRKLVAVGGLSALAACLDLESDVDIPDGDPGERPPRQHGWNEFLDQDEHGNQLLPNHHLLLMLSYEGTDRERDRPILADALEALEHAYAPSPDGLLFTVGYAPSYFERFDESLTSMDLPPAGRVVPGENVASGAGELCLHCASDHASVVLEVEEALFGDQAANEHEVPRIDDIMTITERRTGFIGEGLPAERDRHLRGIPEGEVAADAPTYMNFRSGFRQTQATEDRVTIQNGRFAGGTTMHLEALELRLADWFEHSTDEQIARLFSPNLDEGDVGNVGQELTDHNHIPTRTPGDLETIAREAGVVGHAEKLSRFREDGRPPILRRDVNSDDHGGAGMLFISLQRGFSDFEQLRLAMEGDALSGIGDVGERTNNGILRYFDTKRRETFLVPPRGQRVLP